MASIEDVESVPLEGSVSFVCNSGDGEAVMAGLPLTSTPRTDAEGERLSSKRPQTRQLVFKLREGLRIAKETGETHDAEDSFTKTPSKSPSRKWVRLSLDSGFGSDVSECSFFSSPSSSSLSQGRLKNRDLFTKRGAKKQRSPPKTTLCENVSGKYEGINKVDFIVLLSERGLSHCLESIWAHLSIEDIGRAQQVSAVWRACILSDKKSSSRWQSAKSYYFENLNLNLPNNQHKQLLSKSSPRKALDCVTNRLASPNSKVKSNLTKVIKTTSPGKFRHRLFVEEASRLRPDERLQKCPRCTMPCRVNPSQSLGNCTMLGCMFSFCTICQCTPHANLPCRVSVGPVKPKAVVSSKKSKYRLRRL